MLQVRSCALWFLAGMSAIGCHAGNSDASLGGSGGASSATGSASTASLAGSTSTGDSTGNFMSTSSGTSTSTGGPMNAEVFGHSASTLYKLDPDTKAVTTVADFDGCGDEVIDIALDKDSHLVATTTDGIYNVDRTTAKCSLIKSGSYPNSLSFIPAGTLDPNVEALVGYEGDQYVRIDPSSGNITTVGSLSAGDLSSSGDIVSVKGGGTYLTVNGSIDGNDCFDCLVEVDPKTGKMTKNWGDLGFSAVYGIAFWAGTVYGFDAGGELFQVDFEGSSLKTTLINSPPGVSFYGAGSTTSAPAVPQ